MSIMSPHVDDDAPAPVPVHDPVGRGRRRGRRVLGCFESEATERGAGPPTSSSWTSRCPAGTGVRPSRTRPRRRGAHRLHLTFSDDLYIVRALAMGARGYLIKQDVASGRPGAPARGRGLRPEEVLERSTTMGLGGRAGGRSRLRRARDCPTRTCGASAALTDREYEVVEPWPSGLDNAGGRSAVVHE